ncbi:MAG TPA: cytochrome c biogenesis protein CcsA [Candidatus Limnocylindria bacterium]|nr:cytochrome c biogenesis protein CcsA [Candidatus Limnocylindria bacterium]
MRNPAGGLGRPSPTLSILPAALLAGALIALLGSAVLGLAGLVVRSVAARAAAAGAYSGAPHGWIPLGGSALASIGHAGTLLALVLLAGWLALRTVAAARAPWANLHEFSVAFAAVLLAAYAVVERRHAIRPLAPLVAALAAGLVGVALSLDAPVEPLVPALQQPLLLTVHVGSALLAYAISAVAFVAAIGELLARAAGDRVSALPTADACRRAAHHAVLVGFPILTAAIALGSVWANLAWRSYWSNDPKELAAAATWLVYGAYLHAAGRRDRWGRCAPWLLVVGFGGVLFTYLAASFLFVGEHSYAGA